MESPKDDWMFVLDGDRLRAEIKRREREHERLRNCAQHVVDRWFGDGNHKHAMDSLRELLEGSA
jgi:hypothetical protein